MDSGTKRYVCIHGHFYQPPRENPWLEAIELQPSAHPFHDWNERVAFECYTPNSQAKILNEHGRLRAVANNYEQISFDIGPTLLSWMKEHASQAYQAILAADAASRKQRSGHGNAIAAPYNHMIMPLANRRDKITQVLWGLEDFRSRFHREPEGMWLPETAVDKETLEILAENGILFTILAPRQAARFRTSSKGHWVNLEPGTIDPSRPYMCRLSRGLTIVLFFYDGPISQAVAFQQLLNSGEDFKNRLLAAFSPSRTWPQLVHIATDGESYGHHHRFGEMALAYALEKLSNLQDIELTNYADFLAKHPATAEAEIIENSSWSCVHGVGRWTQDCGCRVSDKPGWNQKWRAPLRQALDLARDRVDRIFEQQSQGLLQDPREARNAYVATLLDHRANLSRFLALRTTRKLKPAERERVLVLLEMQRNRMLMYTSCGWFFDEISGIEAMQVLRYAARVLQLAAPFDETLLGRFVHKLAPARSNLKPHLSGDQLFLERVYAPAIELPHVAAHVTISSVFEEKPPKGQLYSYDIQIMDMERRDSEERVIVTTRMNIQNRMTTERQQFVTALVYFGGVDLRCSVAKFNGKAKYLSMKEALLKAFEGQYSTDLIREMDAHFPGNYFSFRDLFADRRREILDLVTDKMYEEQAVLMERFYKKNRDLIKLLVNHEIPVPDTFFAAAEFVLHRMVANELAKLSRGDFPDQLQTVLEEMALWDMKTDTGEAERLIRDHVLKLVTSLGKNPWDEHAFADIRALLAQAGDLALRLDLSESQIMFFRLGRSLSAQAEEDLPHFFPELAEILSVEIDS